MIIKKLIFLFILAVSFFQACADIGTEYPNLASGILTYAKLKRNLPPDILLQAESLAVAISRTDIDQAIKKYPSNLADELKNNLFFILEQEAAGMLLAAIARKNTKNSNTMNDNEVIQKYLNSIVEEVSVTETEITDFYNNNKALFSGAALEQMKDQIRQHLLNQKKQDHIYQYIMEFGQKEIILVSQTWVDEQIQLAFDNPINKALKNGKPTVVAFSSAGCCGPDVVKPMLDGLNSKYKDTVNIISIDPKEEQILAARFNVFSVPSFIFYDKKGKEQYRENGNLTAEQVELQLLKIK